MIRPVRTRPLACAVITALLAAGTQGACARFAAPPDSPTRAVVWSPRALRVVSRRADVAPVAPFVPAAARNASGETFVSPDAIGAFRLKPGAVVRVTHLSPESGATLRFARIVGRNPATRAVVSEPGVSGAPNTWHLAQPPDGADVWMVWATRRTRISVETVRARHGRLVWDVIRSQVLRWIDGDAVFPPVPDTRAGTQLTRRLRAGEAIAAAARRAFPGDRRTHQALSAWRKARALIAIELARPAVGPYVQRRDLVVQPGLRTDIVGAAVPLATARPGPRSAMPRQASRVIARGYTILNGPVARPLRLTGPGTLRVETRAIAGREVSPLRRLTASVSVDGLLLATSDRLVRPARIFHDDSTISFPVRHAVRTADGRSLGYSQVLRVPLFPGANDYVIRIGGATSVVRATVLRRASRLRESITKRGVQSHWIRIGRKAVDGHRSPGADVARRLLDGLAGPRIESAPLGPVPALLGLAALAPVALRVTAPSKARVARVRALVSKLPAARHRDVAWLLRIEFARAFARWGIDNTDLLARSKSAPASLQRSVAELLAGTNRAPLFRDVFDTIERYWRSSAGSPTRIDDYVQAWRAGAWRSVGAFSGDAAQALRPWSWIRQTTRAERDKDPSRGGTTLWQLPLGTAVDIAAPTSAFAPSRPALMRLYAITPAATPGPLGISVDGSRWATLGFARVEPLTFSVPAGTHRVKAIAPVGSIVLSDLPPADPAVRARLAGQATLRRLWPTSHAGIPTRFRLPESTRAPVRIELATLAGSRADRRVQLLSLRSKTGVLRTIRWRPSAADPRFSPLSAPSGLSSLVRFTVRLPAGTRTVWFDDAPAGTVASVAVRVGRAHDSIADRRHPSDSRSPNLSSPTTPGDPILTRIRRLSSALASRPTDPSLRLDRAEQLLYIGAAHRARADISWLEGVPVTGRVAERRRRLELALSAWFEPRHLRIQPRGGVLHGVRAIAPALLALSQLGATETPGDLLAAWTDVARKVRMMSREPTTPRHSVPRGSSARRRAAVRARLHTLDGHHARAAGTLVAALATETSWPLSLAAMRGYAEALRRGSLSSGAATVAFGLASRLRPRIEHRAVRAVLRATARMTRWRSITRLSTSAGFERADLTPRASDYSPGEQLLASLAAPPWRDIDAHLLRPGRGARLQLSLRSPARLHIKVWCRSLAARAATRVACPFEMQRGSRAAEQFHTPPAHRYSHPVIELQPGQHDIAVVLGRADSELIASVKFDVQSVKGTTRGAGVLRAVRLHVATPDRPVRFSLRGPTTLRVRARADLAESASRVQLSVLEVGSAGKRMLSLPLSRDADAAAVPHDKRTVRIGKLVERELLLPSSAVYRVTARPAVGRVLLRFAHRRAAAPEPSETTITDSAEPPSPAGATRSLRIEAASPWPAPATLGTLSLELVAGNQAIVEADFDVRDLVSTQTSLAAAWRKELLRRRLWLRARAITRSDLRDSTAFGGRAAAELRRLPGGLRASVRLSGLLQGVEGSRAWSVRTMGRVERQYARTWGTLTPGVTVRSRTLSLRDREDLVGRVDPLILSDYARTHSFALISQLIARRYVYQDQIGSLSARVVSNADVASIDQISLTATWRGLLELSPLRGPLFRLRYRPALRFADRDRRSTSLRSDFGAGLEWTTWNGRRGRLLLGLDSNVYVTNLSSAAFVIRLGLRYDFGRGRGLGDLFPAEQELDHLVGWRLWADR